MNEFLLGKNGSPLQDDDLINIGGNNSGLSRNRGIYDLSS